MGNRASHIIKAPSRLFRRLYNWTVNWSHSKRSSLALFLVAFAESSFFPVPPDVLLIPMVIGNRAKWLLNASICALGSVSGALLGYFIGWVLWASVGQAIVDFYKLHHAMEVIRHQYSQNAFITVLAAAFTPIPYKVITIAAGLCKINIAVLLIASAIGRSSRFFLVAGLLRIFGKRISDAIEKYFDLASLIFMALLIGGFLAIRYLR